MSESIRTSLLALQQNDLALRVELAGEGSLFAGYHPRMEALHRANAEWLRELIQRVGWPNEHLAGVDGAEAAWLIAQHSIGEPEFMRMCRDLLRKEVDVGGVPQWQYAYLDDRIRVSEGKPQRFGTQFDLTPEGPLLCPVDDPPGLDQRRKEAGLRPIDEHLKGAQSQPRPSHSDYEARKKAALEWSVAVGWQARGD